MHGLKSYLRFLNSSSCNLPKPFSTQTTLQSAGPMACLLKTRSVIRFKGPETVKFLQGLVTNDVRSLENPEAAVENAITPNMPVAVSPPVYAAMLTPQGRYRLRSKVDIENVAEAFSCWQRFGRDLNGKSSSVEEPEADSVGWGGTVDRSGVSASQANSLGWHWHKDPRLACLGYRGIFPSNAMPPLVEQDKETDEENYLLWRLEKGVAEGSTEIPKGEAIPLEYNLSGLNAINFDKGCYIGQELIARTHHRGVIRKRLIPLRFLNSSGEEVEQKVSPGTEVINSTSQKKTGTVTTAIGSCGLGLLRLDEAFKEASSLTIKGQEDVNIETIRPKWWPSEWSLDHQQQMANA